MPVCSRVVTEAWLECEFGDAKTDVISFTGTPTGRNVNIHSLLAERAPIGWYFDRSRSMGLCPKHNNPETKSRFL
jgi:hypothetical protein